MNEFNTITNKLSSNEIEFDYEIWTLILLSSLPNSLEAIRMVFSNSAGKMKLKYNDIHDLILVEEVHKRDFGNISGSDCTLNVDARGRAHDRTSSRGRSK